MLKPIITAACALALTACATHAHKGAAQKAPGAPHLETTVSAVGFEQTLTQLQTAIDARDFKTFAIVDHAKGAASIGEDLRPTTLIIFGAPRGGTPLIQADQRMGLQLPLKIVIYTDANGGVAMTYPDYKHIAREYALDGREERISKIAGALAAITQEAARAQ